MTPNQQRIEELSKAAEALVAGPPEFLRAFAGDDAGARQQRRSIIVASLRDQEAEGRVGVSVEDLAADLDAVLRHRGQPAQVDLRAEVVEVLRQLEGWQAVDGGLAPERAERDGLRRRVERDYALARSLRVFLPRWDEVQRLLRRRYISLSANYFAQAIAALDTLLEELHYEDTDPLRCHTAWQSLHQALHGINTETRDFARELRSLRVDGNHPEVLADIADRLGILHEKFFRVAAEGAAKVRDRLELLRDERHAGENVRRLQEALRAREEEWSVGIGETEAERIERLDAVVHDIVKELNLYDRFMADSGPGSWREGAKIISLALVDLTERIHAAISLRLQQTQAIAALLRRAQHLAEAGKQAADATQRARQYLWNASGAIHGAVWVQSPPSSDDQVRLDRWLAAHGGSPLPLVEDEIWQKSIRPRLRPAPPPPPPPLELADDWNPGDDPRIRELEEARARLVERLIAAGSAANLQYLHSFDELRLLASFLWLPRNSAPLRRLGLRIQPPGAGMAAQAAVAGPNFTVEMDNYRFSAITAARVRPERTEAAADAMRAPNPLTASHMREAGGARTAKSTGRAPGPQPSVPAAPDTLRPTAPLHDVDDLDALVDVELATRPLPALTPDTVELNALVPDVLPPGDLDPRPTAPLPTARSAPTQPRARPGMPSAWVKPDPERQPEASGRRKWPLGGLLGRRGAAPGQRQGE
jgi:hypothetical protein